MIDNLVLLIGAADLGASKHFYVERGLSVKRSFPGRYVEFDAPAGGIKLALYPGRAGVAKDAGISPTAICASRCRWRLACRASESGKVGPRCSPMRSSSSGLPRAMSTEADAPYLGEFGSA
jgi:hypothetical protein